MPRAFIRCLKSCLGSLALLLALAGLAGAAGKTLYGVMHSPRAGTKGLKFERHATTCRRATGVIDGGFFLAREI